MNPLHIGDMFHILLMVSEWTNHIMAVTATGACAVLAAAAQRDVTAPCAAANGGRGDADDARHGRLVAQVSYGRQFRPGLFDNSHGKFFCSYLLLPCDKNVSC